MLNLIESLLLKHKINSNGHLAAYIPELAQVDPKLFAISIVDIKGHFYTIGDQNIDFTLQSTSKPFMYGLALNTHGETQVHKRVGIEPSGEAFDSIIELEKKTHLPYNPMINSGAIAIANQIQSANRIQTVLNHFAELTNRELTFDQKVFESEKKTAHRNRAIAHLLRHFDVIGDDIEETLDLYFKQCSIQVKIQDLALMGAVLANHGLHPISKNEIYSPQVNRNILSLMFTCGMYDSAGEWAYSVGLPAKSGVSGAILAIIPNKMCIAVYSPLINAHGHSVRGVEVIKEFANKLKFNLFV